ncbi:MAG: hypothetical protein AAF961_11010 [Planctomycetota bacterium]
MHKFTDNQGDEWSVWVDTRDAKRVRKLVGVDLLLPDLNAMIETLAGDPIALVDSLYVICQEQCQQREISDEEFGRRLVGDAIDAATVALLEALADFFPSRRSQLLRTLVAKIRAADQRMLDRAHAVIADGRLDRAIDRELAKSEQELDAILDGGT